MTDINAIMLVYRGVTATDRDEAMALLGRPGDVDNFVQVGLEAIGILLYEGIGFQALTQFSKDLAKELHLDQRQVSAALETLIVRYDTAAQDTTTALKEKLKGRDYPEYLTD